MCAIRQERNDIKELTSFCKLWWSQFKPSGHYFLLTADQNDIGTEKCCRMYTFLINYWCQTYIVIWHWGENGIES